MSIHQVVDPDAGANILRSLRIIMSIHQVVDPDAGVNTKRMDRIEGT
jgi:hypothetical protein